MDRETNPDELIIYHTEDGSSKVSLYATDGTVWMTQAQMTSLFEISKSSVSEHISHILADKELKKEAVVRKFRTTAKDIENSFLALFLAPTRVQFVPRLL